MGHPGPIFAGLAEAPSHRGPASYTPADLETAMRHPALLVVASGLATLLLAGAGSGAGRASLMAGLMDPFLGLDHLLALLLVGTWAGRLRGPELWALPAAFLAGTVPGFALAADQVSIPVVEGLVHLLILASLVSLAAALLVPLRLPTREAVSTVAMFGGCHGYIHGVEVGSEQAMWFGLGALASAALLLASGVVVGLASPQLK